MKNIFSTKIPRDKVLFIFINIFVSIVGFGRSFVFMKSLTLFELGVLTIIQTIAMFAGMMQLGLINGGYRIFALDIKDQNQKINNLLFSYFGVLSIIMLALWLFSFFWKLNISNWFILCAIFIGVQSLIVNWLSNTLIGSRRIKQLNQINFWSSLAMILVLPLAFFWGLWGAILSLSIQPVIFIVLALLYNKDLRPTFLCLDKKLFIEILRYGFIPFLAGILALVNLQIERWIILDKLGTEELGKFYLVFLYSILFVLIPNSVSSIFFPICIKSFADGDIIKFKSFLLKHYFIIIVYSAVIAISTVLCLEYFIDLLLPQHSENVVYVFYYMPGLIFLILCDPLTLLLNSVFRLNVILFSCLISVFVNIILIVIAIRFNIFSLKSMAIIKSIVNVSMFMCYVIYIITNRKTIFINTIRYRGSNVSSSVCISHETKIDS